MVRAEGAGPVDGALVLPAAPQAARPAPSATAAARRAATKVIVGIVSVSAMPPPPVRRDACARGGPGFRAVRPAAWRRPGNWARAGIIGSMEGRAPLERIGSFVALGDSFTEGLNDRLPDGSYRGWADRFADTLSVHQPGLRYANLAVRGKLLREVAAEQVPRAVDMAPDLVSIAAGGNDILRPGTDPDALAEVFDECVAGLRAAGCRVLIFTGFDPSAFPVIRMLRGKTAAFNMYLRAIADAHDCDIVDLWPMRVLCDRRMWSADRLHLTAEGHRRVALRVCE